MKDKIAMMISTKKTMITMITMIFSIIRSFAQVDDHREAEALSLSGHLDEKSAELTILAKFPKGDVSSEKLIFTTRLEDNIFVSRGKIEHETTFDFARLQGCFDEIVLGFEGGTTLENVSCPHLLHWGIRHFSNNRQELLLVFDQEKTPLDEIKVIIKHSRKIEYETKNETKSMRFPLTTWRLPNPILGTGMIILVEDDSIFCQLKKRKNLHLFEPDEDSEIQHFSFHGTNYDAEFDIQSSDPDADRLILTEMKIEGRLYESSVSFLVEGIAKTQNPKGARLDLLKGKVALRAMNLPQEVEIILTEKAHQLHLEEAGSFPISFQFDARIEDQNGWKKTYFHLTPVASFEFELSDFDEGTEFEFEGGTPFEFTDEGKYVGFIPADGEVDLAWREGANQTSTRPFFNTESLSQIRIGTGLVRQRIGIELHVMQGELSEMIFDLLGEGEMTRVSAEGLLSWEIRSIDEARQLRQLELHFNQSQKGRSRIVIEAVSPLASFPVEITPMRITPKASDRHHGMIEIVNDGAVRLDVSSAIGLSRITPQISPADHATSKIPSPYPHQKFAFRHSLSEYELKIQAAMIKPDIALSALIVHHLGYDQIRIDADLELEIREAPIREFVFDLPADYVLAELVSASLADFFLERISDRDDDEDHEDHDDHYENRLRLVFSKPIFGQHSIRLRLEKNQANQDIEDSLWMIGKVVPKGVRQVRGHLGITSMEGYRLAPEKVNGLIEIANVYFPKKLDGLQVAFRFVESDWELSLTARSIDQEIQSDAFHMFTLGNGMISASSLFHFEISGSPLDELQFSVPNEYRNLVFTGREVRNWSQNKDQYRLQFQTPLIGSYTLLVTYERPLKEGSDTLNASGIIPKNATSDQGMIVLSSHRQIRLEENELSQNLIRLSPDELIPEKRLLIQQPVLAAYQYNQRPIGLMLKLETLSEVGSLQQIIDRAEIHTRISHDGQTLSMIKYVIKSSDLSHLKLSLPEGTHLWSAKVNEKKIIPIETSDGTLLPLHSDEGDLRILELELAAMSNQSSPVKVKLPTLDVPLLYAQWHFEAAPKRKLRFLKGSVEANSIGQMDDGYDQIAALFRGEEPWRKGARSLLIIALAAIFLGSWLLHFSRNASLANRPIPCCLARILAGLALLGGILIFVSMSFETMHQLPKDPPDLISQSRIMMPNSAFEVELENRPKAILLRDVFQKSLPFAFAIFFLSIARFGFGKKFNEKFYEKFDANFREKFDDKIRFVSEVAMWIILLFGILNWQVGGPLSLLLLLAFLLRNFVFPVFLRIRHKAIVPILIVSMSLNQISASSISSSNSDSSNSSNSSSSKSSSIPKKVHQTLRIERDHAVGKAVIQWRAVKHEMLHLLRSPAILTNLGYDDARLRLSVDLQKPISQGLIALESGDYEIEFEYQIPISHSDQIMIPTSPGLINRLEVALAIPNTILKIPEAISIISRKESSENETDSEITNWEILLPAKDEIALFWMPRIRNRSQESPVFFAEWTHLIVPSSGLLEGFHDVSIRPTRGEISNLSIKLPDEMTINEVCADSLLSWRLDPDLKRVHIDLSHPHSDPFWVRILSQSRAHPLPYTKMHQPLIAEDASGQVGTLALSTDSDIQLSEIEFQNLVVIDPQDFTQPLLEFCQSRFPSTPIRHAFRYTGSDVHLKFRASQVAPHITIRTDERLSIGEDRILLASNLQAEVTRAGIFSLSFRLPKGLNIDSVTGDRLSHWSEKIDSDERNITMHLKRRWKGEMTFNLTLSGAGITNKVDWNVPKIRINEAARQQGQIVIIPEKGIRLEATTRENTSQVDARSRGFRMSNALAFDLLNADWKLIFRLEQVDPWLELTSLQDVSFSEGKAHIHILLDIQIKNTAIKDLSMILPKEALHVRFNGKNIADVIQGKVDSETQDWTIRLGKRTLGSYHLSIRYQSPLPEKGEFHLGGIQIPMANSQRGYLTLRSQGRLQISIPKLPDSLYPTDSKNLPPLESHSGGPAISRSFRIVNPNYELSLKLRRDRLSPVLPAKVKGFQLTTLVSARGSSLTRASINLISGNKRSLAVSLPKGSEFWFARVNRQGTITWKQKGILLIPLTQNLSKESEIQVEFYYHSIDSSFNSISDSDSDSSFGSILDSTLQGFGLDIPPSSVRWTIFLDPKWDLKRWTGNLELVSETQHLTQTKGLDEFLEREFRRRAGRHQEAEKWLQQGNQLLNEGNDQMARNAFSNAYGLIRDDAAFSEDARVQLQTLKTQQAMAGIRVGQSQSKIILSKDLFSSVGQILSQSDPDEMGLINLADRLISQHEDHTIHSSGFDINLPEEGTKLEFVKSVQVEDTSKLHLQIHARSKKQDTHFGVILGVIMIFLSALRKRIFV